MAKVKFSALISEMRNKLNGSVFSKNKGGNYLRNKVTPVNPRTEAQTKVRSNFGAFSSQFRGLGLDGVAAWNAAAANFPYSDIFGDTKYLSGLQLYVKLNLNLAQALADPITTPPQVQPVAGVIINSAVLTRAGTTDAVVLEFIGETTNMALVLEATPGLSPGISFFKNKYRQILTQDAGTALTSAAINTAYVGAFGLPILGLKVSFRVHMVATRTGQVSPSSTFEVSVG